MTTRDTKARGFRPGLVALALTAGLLAASGAEAGPEDWSAMGDPDTQRNLPGVERNGTLRILRFSTDGTNPLEDQGTLVGWANGAATGTLVERRDDEKAPEETLLEIVDEKPSPLK